MRVSLAFVMSAAAMAAACGGSSSTDNLGGGGNVGGNAGNGGVGGTTTTTTTTPMVVDPCETAGSEPVSFVNDVQPIFSSSCGDATHCHLDPTPSEGLSLKVGEAYADLVNVPAKQDCNGQVRVLPGSAVGSYLINKITATGVCPGEKKMPPNSSLSAAKKQTIIDWVCQGAPEN